MFAAFLMGWVTAQEHQFMAVMSPMRNTSKLFINVLGRNSDLACYNYWVGNLNNGIETWYETLLGFAESAENKTLFSEMTGFI